MAEETQKNTQQLQQLPHHLEWVLLGLVIAGAIAARLILLREIMPGPRLDELKTADTVISLLDLAPDYHMEILENGELRATAYHAVIAWMWSVLGHNLYTMRLTSTLFGLIAIVAGFLLARRLFGNRVGLFAAAALAFTFIPIYYSRTALPFISLPVFSSLAALGLYSALDPEAKPVSLPIRLLWAAGGGICFALALYTSQGTIALGVMFVIFTAIMATRKLITRDRGIAAAIFFGTAAIAYIPGLISIDRTIGLRAFLAGLWNAGTDITIGQLVVNSGKVLLMLVGKGEEGWIANISGQPFFPAFMSILFIGGFLYALWYSRKPAYLFALLLLAAGLLPGIWADSVPSFSATINTLAIAYAFPAIALVTLDTWLVFLLPEQKKLIHSMLVMIVGIYLASSLTGYFLRWAKQDEAITEYNPTMLKLAEYIEEHRDISAPIISTSLADFWEPWDRKAFNLLYEGNAEARFFDGSTSLIAPASDSSAWYFLTPTAPMHADWWFIISQAELIEQVLDDDGQRLFTVYRLPDGEAAGERMAENDVAEWELGFTLVDYDLRFDEAITPMRHDIEKWIYTPGETILLQSTWQVLTPPSEPIVMYVHLLDSNGRWIAGWDDLDVPVEGWVSGDIFTLKHDILIPGDLPGGTYTLTVGWYSPISLTRQPLFLNDREIGDALEIADIIISAR